MPLSYFRPYILLTNFHNYVEMFAQKYDVDVNGVGKPMQTASAGDITIINFGMGSPMAATVMDLLAAVKPKATLFLGKAGGLKRHTLLISDNPMIPDGVKTEESDRKVTGNFVEKHLQIGIDALEELASSGESVKHLRFE